MAENSVDTQPRNYIHTGLLGDSKARAVEALPQLLTTSQAARLLKVTPRTVTRLCEKGEIKAVRVASLWRINRDALLKQLGLD